MALYHIEIPRRARSCALQGEEFKGGTHYVSLLKYDNKGGCQRTDYCEACWGKVDLSSYEGVVYWKSQVPLKSTAPDQSLKREERALELLRECLQSEGSRAEAYVLALLLTRTKQLVLRQEMIEEEELLQLYEIKSTEEMLMVYKQNLTPSQIEEVKRRLAEQLA